MAAPTEYRGHHVTVATDSLGGTSFGRVINYVWTFDKAAEPSYELGNQSPFTISLGNKRFSGVITMAFIDIDAIMTLLTNDATADTHFVRYSTGITDEEQMDITITGIQYGSGSVNAANDGSQVEETYPFEATGISMEVTTV